MPVGGRTITPCFGQWTIPRLNQGDSLGNGLEARSLLRSENLALASTEVIRNCATLVGGLENALTAQASSLSRQQSIRVFRIPITSFQLTVNDAPRPNAGSFVTLNAFWADDAGCRHGASNAPILQNVRPLASTTVSLSLEHMVCNDRQDLGLQGTADAAFNSVEGPCSNGGPNCRFQMIRQ